MTDLEWHFFCKQKAKFKEYCQSSIESFNEVYTPPSLPLNKYDSMLKNSIMQSVWPKPTYTIETPIVYNHNIDKINKNDNISLILVGDNPGKEEQHHNNQAYLVGQAGRIADGFFKKNSELAIDFKKNIIILNKSILHTPKTIYLKNLIKKDPLIKDFFIKDQIWQAHLAIALQCNFNCPLWIVGYSQMGKQNLFFQYSNIMIEKYSNNNNPPLFLYQHFSMNCFIKQLKKEWDSSFSLKENLNQIGIKNRQRILGF